MRVTPVLLWPVAAKEYLKSLMGEWWWEENSCWKAGVWRCKCCTRLKCWRSVGGGVFPLRSHMLTCLSHQHTSFVLSFQFVLLSVQLLCSAGKQQCLRYNGIWQFPYFFTLRWGIYWCLPSNNTVLVKRPRLEGQTWTQSRVEVSDAILTSQSRCTSVP